MLTFSRLEHHSLFFLFLTSCWIPVVEMRTILKTKFGQKMDSRKNATNARNGNALRISIRKKLRTVAYCLRVGSHGNHRVKLLMFFFYDIFCLMLKSLIWSILSSSSTIAVEADFLYIFSLITLKSWREFFRICLVIGMQCVILHDSRPPNICQVASSANWKLKKLFHRAKTFVLSALLCFYFLS